ncbi:MAG: hypothetical protein HQ510_03910 [Candidatus Marinimicrobia bacterium]|nr:hypothetical protein [Candidatus Neomarinimicrobiota bacterium]
MSNSKSLITVAINYIKIICLFVSFVYATGFSSSTSFTGELKVDGVLVNGTVSIIFSFVGHEWSQEESILVVDGIYMTQLGSEDNPIPLAVFDQDEPAMLQISVNGVEMEPVSLNSVPYARVAEKALMAESVAGLVFDGDSLLTFYSLRVTDVLYVGDSTLVLGTHTNGPANQIYATQGDLILQSYNLPTVGFTMNTIMNTNPGISANSGNVGIGTNNPTAKLEVWGNDPIPEGGSYPSTIVKFEENPSHSNHGGGIQIDEGDYGDLFIRGYSNSGGGETFRFNTAGINFINNRFGVGTINPDASVVMHVEPIGALLPLRISGLDMNNTLSRVLVTTDAGVVYWRDAATLPSGGQADMDWDVNISPGDVVTGHGGQYPSGNVGIGTTTPQGKLDVQNIVSGQGIHFRGATSGSNNDPILTIESPIAGGNAGAKGLLINIAGQNNPVLNNETFIFEANSIDTTRFVITQDGKVGIGPSHTGNMIFPDNNLDVWSSNPLDVATIGVGYALTTSNGDLMPLDSNFAQIDFRHQTPWTSQAIPYARIHAQRQFDPVVPSNPYASKLLFSTRDAGGLNTQMLIDMEGDVFVGVSQPATLHVNDILHLEPTSTPSSPNRGDIYYDDVDDKVKVWTGGTWESMN